FSKAAPPFFIGRGAGAGDASRGSANMAASGGGPGCRVPLKTTMPTTTAAAAAANPFQDPPPTASSSKSGAAATVSAAAGAAEALASDSPQRGQYSHFALARVPQPGQTRLCASTTCTPAIRSASPSS